MRRNTLSSLVDDLLAMRDEIDNVRAKHKGEDEYAVSDEVLADLTTRISDVADEIQDNMDNINSIIGL